MTEEREPARARILIRGGRVIDPASGLDATADVIVAAGRIEAVGRGIGAGPVAAGDRAIDARGLVVTPGLVDIHVHLREPGFETKETIADGARAAAAGGFTTICCMPNTDPPLDTRAACEFVIEEGRRAGAARVLPIGCVSKGRKGDELAELADLARGGAVAFSDDGFPVKTSVLLRRALTYARMLDRVVIDHCEDLALAASGFMHEGLVSLALGLPGKPAASEDVIVARDLLIAEAEAAPIHVAHASTKGAIELVRRAKERGVRVTCEVTPHHLLLTDDECRGFDASRHKMNPPLRSQDHVLATLAGLADGTVDAIASDHAPHTREEKDVEWGLAPDGVIGLETTLPVTFGLVERGAITLARAIELLTVGPARALGLPAGTGTLAVGAPADIALLDIESSYSIDAARFRSRSRNTPFDGLAVRGRAACVLVDGRVVHDIVAERAAS